MKFNCQFHTPQGNKTLAYTAYPKTVCLSEKKMAATTVCHIAEAPKAAGVVGLGLTSSPGPRGSRACLVRGRVLTVLAYYGWIGPLQEIDHPSADKHEGRIYFRLKDVGAGVRLAPGLAVSFYLYADDQGLGAEAVCPTDLSFHAATGTPAFVPMATAKVGVQPPWKAKKDTADAETDLSSGAEDDSASDSDVDSACTPPAACQKAMGAPAPQILNLGSYEDEDSDGDCGGVIVVAAKPPPAGPTTSMGSTPWRATLPPPGLEAVAPQPSLRCSDGGGGWLRDLPWRR